MMLLPFFAGRRAPGCTRLPYTTLFRSTVACQQLDARRWALGAAGERVEVEVQDDRSKQIEALTGQGRKVVAGGGATHTPARSEEQTSELQPPDQLVCRLLLEQTACGSR